MNRDWYLHGQVRSWITAAPGSVYLGDISVCGAEMLAPHLVTLKVHESVSRLIAHRPPDLAAVRVAQDANPERYLLEITPQRLSVAPVDLRVQLSAKTRLGQTLPDVFLPGTGAVVPDVYCLPKRLFFKERLHDIIKKLNRAQDVALIRFHGDGTGTGVLWELLDSESLSGGTAAPERP